MNINKNNDGKNIREIINRGYDSHRLSFYSSEGGGHEAVGQMSNVADWLLGTPSYIGAPYITGKAFLANAFSLQMLADEASLITVLPCTPEDVPADAQSCIGHNDTAKVVSSILGREVPCQRINVTLNAGDVLYVAQLTGGRLPEGATTLPEGFTIAWKKVIVN